MLKCLRLCRLLGDEDGILLFTYESSGYPKTEGGYLTSEAWRIAKMAGRTYFRKDKKSGKNNEYANTCLVAEIEETIQSQKIRLSSAVDPSISITSANPNQYLHAPTGNTRERTEITSQIIEQATILSKVKGALYAYILPIYNKLVYGNIVEDIFTNARLKTNEKLSILCPKSIEKFVAVYENLSSDNSEDWANAVHSCRRILLDLADSLYPPSDIPLMVNGKQVKVGKEQYINRLVQYITSKSGSKTYCDVVGSDLSSIGNRLDAINDAVCKGTHVDVTKEEAIRYIIHTYLLISDVIDLEEN